MSIHIHTYASKPSDSGAPHPAFIKKLEIVFRRMKVVNCIDDFYWLNKPLKKLFRNKTDSEAEQYYCSIIQYLYNEHKNPSATPNMLLKLFKLTS